MHYYMMWKKSATAKSDGHTSVYHPTLLEVKRTIENPPPAWVEYDKEVDPEWWMKLISHEREALDKAIAIGDPATIHMEMLHEAAALVKVVHCLYEEA